jgi:predicted N-acetyltransferase YhbS
MRGAADFIIRPARQSDAKALFEVTRASVEGLTKDHYSEAQIAGWMSGRTTAYYETVIAGGRAFVAERDGGVVGFVDAVPGELTRLFILPGAAAQGIGRALLRVGIENARKGHIGPIRVEATLNATGFYRRHGFESVGAGHFSHGAGGDPIAIMHMELPVDAD